MRLKKEVYPEILIREIIIGILKREKLLTFSKLLELTSKKLDGGINFYKFKRIVLEMIDEEIVKLYPYGGRVKYKHLFGLKNLDLEEEAKRRGFIKHKRTTIDRDNIASFSTKR